MKKNENGNEHCHNETNHQLWGRDMVKKIQSDYHEEQALKGSKTRLCVHHWRNENMASGKDSLPLPRCDRVLYKTINCQNSVHTLYN